MCSCATITKICYMKERELRIVYVFVVWTCFTWISCCLEIKGKTSQLPLCLESTTMPHPVTTLHAWSAQVSKLGHQGCYLHSFLWNTSDGQPWRLSWNCAAVWNLTHSAHLPSLCPSEESDPYHSVAPSPTPSPKVCPNLFPLWVISPTTFLYISSHLNISISDNLDKCNSLLLFV